MNYADVYPHLVHILNLLSHVRKSWRPHGAEGWIACCPSHEDRHPSLSIAIGKKGQVLLHCHAGCSVEQIVQALGLTLSDLFLPMSTPRKQAHHGITLLDFARDKNLSWRFLINQGIVEDVRGGLRIPYYNLDGTPAVRHRIRTALVAKEGSRWTPGPGEIVPYGLEGLKNIQQAGSLILVEGETDTLTLRIHGYPALGIPGAEMVRTTLKLSYLEGLHTLYIVQEPDPAGAHFVTDILALIESWHWQGQVLTVSLLDAKDPGALHQRDPQAFPACFQQALEQAVMRYDTHPPELEAKTPSALPPSSSSSSSHDHNAPLKLQQLLETTFLTPEWVISDMVPAGLVLFGGKPKQGKSWLALQMALAVSTGKALFDCYPTHAGDVLYLALEDTLPRLQDRARRLLSTIATPPTGLELAVTWPRLDQGGLPQLQSYIEHHPQLRLIVIDTWGKIAPRPSSRARTQYEEDYAALAPLKEIADTHHLSFVLVHHLRKAAGKDVLDEVNGSIGLVGAVDAILLLKRDREQEDASLFVTGRDVPEQSLTLTFDPTIPCWTYAVQEDALEKGAIHAFTETPAS